MTVAPFEIQTSLTAGVNRLSVVGELDLATAPVLARHIDEATATGASAVELDVSRVSFIDATGLRLLLAAGNRPGRTGGGPGLSIVAISPAIRRLLELTGLAGAFGVEAGGTVERQT